jgi:ketosteroid isomerase-like protein
MAPDIVWNEAENFPYADGNPYRDPEAVLHGVFARIGADWENFTVTSGELIDGGDTIVSLGRYGGVCKGTGKPLSAQYAHVFRVKNGKIAAFQQYTDTLGTARAMER